MDAGDTILRLEHENDVLRKKIELLEAELEVWKRSAEAYAKIVREGK